MEPHNNFSSAFDFNKSLNYTSVNEFGSSSRPYTSHSYQNDTDKLREQKSSFTKFLEQAAVIATYGFVALTAPISLPFYFKSLDQHEVAIVSRIGGELNAKSGGSKFISLPILDTFEKFSTKPIKFKISEKDVLSKDKFQINVEGVASYKITDPLKFVREVSSSSRSESTEGGDNDKKFIKTFVITTIRRVLGERDYQKIQDEIGIRNEILMSCNYVLTSQWGIILLADGLDLQFLVTKRGEDGPGDPMHQIIGLVKEYFDLDGEESSKSKNAQIPGMGLGGPMPLVLPGNGSKLGQSDLAQMAKMMVQGSNIMHLHQNGNQVEQVNTTANPVCGSSFDQNSANSSQPLLNHQVTNSGTSQAWPIKTLNLEENDIQNHLSNLLELENFTSHKAPNQFKNLNKKCFKITITDFENPFPGYSSNDKVSLYVNGRDVERPFIFSINEKSRELGSQVDVEINLLKRDIIELIEGDLPLVQKSGFNLKGYISERILKYVGDEKMIELIAVARFIKCCME